jgi:hypothetical protein
MCPPDHDGGVTPAKHAPIAAALFFSRAIRTPIEAPSTEGLLAARAVGCRVGDRQQCRRPGNITSYRRNPVTTGWD